MLKVLIDCDPGIDDAAALILAIRSFALDIVAVTTVSGNLHADICARNAIRVLDLLGRDDIPVAAGAMTPLVGVLQPDPFSHGRDGLADLGLPEPGRQVDERDAASLMTELANAHEGRLHIIGLGPLTNIARALAIDPELPRKVERLTIIGGAYGLHATGATRATGANPVSEWNISVDPEAASVVFAAGFNLVALGLDVTTSDDAGLAPHHCAALARSADPAASFLRATDAFVRGRGFGGYCAVIDAFAVAAVIRPDLVTTRPLRVGVETTGTLTRGQTVVDRREHFQWSHLPVIMVADSIRCNEVLDMIVDAACGVPVSSSLPVADAVADAAEEELATSIAAALRPHIRPDSRFQFDTSAFIPDFEGADEATARLCALPAYQAAQRILVTPDNALISFRARAIADGKTLIMPSYGLVRGFLTLGAQASPLPLPFAAWLDGMEHFSRETTLAELREAGPIALVVAGASAVTEEGVRFGMGHRYLDVEWGLLAELDLVDAATPIAVIVHDSQFTTSTVRPPVHSVGADIIATPSSLVVLPRAARPQSLFEGIVGAALSTSAPIVERARMAVPR